jgi:transcriptional regulator with XRE-family HTH domain
MIFDFGYRLRELRENKNMTQTQVATRLNLSKTTISGYENNIKTPSLDVLIRLSILYGVSADYILGLENRKMLLIDGLSPSQEGIMKILLKEFRDTNKKSLSQGGKSWE